MVGDILGGKQAQEAGQMGQEQKQSNAVIGGLIRMVLATEKQIAELEAQLRLRPEHVEIVKLREFKTRTVEMINELSAQARAEAAIERANKMAAASGTAAKVTAFIRKTGEGRQS